MANKHDNKKRKWFDFKKINLKKSSFSLKDNIGFEPIPKELLFNRGFK